ncbi:hypothetical protein ACI2OX_09015 [Bacillus sp. N9]
MAIALLTDRSKSFRPNQFHQSSYGTTLTYTYNLYKFIDLDEQELLLSKIHLRSLFSLLTMRMKQKTTARNVIDLKEN